MREKSEQIEAWLRAKRHHKRKWPEPSDAPVIFNMHFNVYAYAPHVFHAEATLEIPVGVVDFDYYSISKSDKTKAGALRSVLRELEDQKWYHYFRFKGVRFRITGTEMERVYRGYL